MSGLIRYGRTLPRLTEPDPLPGRRRGEGPSTGCPCGCALSRATTHGYRVIDFARRIGVRLHPWQRWLLIHALELDESLLSFRFRIVLVIVARQNGKTLAKMVVTLWRMYMRNARLCVGIAQDLSQAREVMVEGLIPMMMDSDLLGKRFDPDNDDPEQRVGVWRKRLNDEYIRLEPEKGRHFGPRYLIKALNRRAGRGLWDVEELNIDELREQTDFASWSAVSKIVMAAPNSQIWTMSNAGSRTSVVLNQLRSVGLAGTDPSMFVAEWSAPEDCQLDDREAQAMANPSAGRSLPWAAIRSALLTDPPEVFRTEVLCQFVDSMNAAVDMMGWSACRDPGGSFEGLVRSALVVDVADDGGHVVAALAAVTPDGRVRVRRAGQWSSSAEARRALPDLIALLGPRAVGWFPNGPGSVLSAMMRKLKPAAHEIKGASECEACMLLANLVSERRVLQPGDELLDIHMSQTVREGSSRMWRFERGMEPVHGAYAAAGAVLLAVNEPEQRPVRRTVIVPD